LAEIELAAAEAEVALRTEGLINARSALAKVRLLLLRLLNPPGPNPWGRGLVLRNAPAIPEVNLEDVESHVQVAERMRPDLNEARLQVQHGNLEIVTTRNGLLPKLDLFVSLGKTGFARSFFDSVGDLGGDGYDASFGVLYEYPLGNRDAEARHERALLTHDQEVEAVGNLSQLVELDVRTAHIEVNRAREQVAATAATRRLQEEAFRAETEKFQVGRSTSLLVAQAQRDLVAGRIGEVQAVVSYLNALVDLYRLDGSLLERRGIEAPGRKPVQLSETSAP
jgi:outer membrane protein TolC